MGRRRDRAGGLGRLAAQILAARPRPGRSTCDELIQDLCQGPAPGRVQLVSGKRHHHSVVDTVVVARMRWKAYRRDVFERPMSGAIPKTRCQHVELTWLVE